MDPSQSFNAFHKGKRDKWDANLKLMLKLGEFRLSVCGVIVMLSVKRKTALSSPAYSGKLNHNLKLFQN